MPCHQDDLVACTKALEPALPCDEGFAAAIDRLVHHSTILELTNESYRMKAAGNKTCKEIMPSPQGGGQEGLRPPRESHE